MKSNWCTAFPDRINIPGWITYDISGICKIHDMDYLAGIPRLIADRAMLDRLLTAYPEYRILWGIVYRAVRKVGWLFYMTKKLGLPEAIQDMAAKKVRVAITASLQRYAKREAGQNMVA